MRCKVSGCCSAGTCIHQEYRIPYSTQQALFFVVAPFKGRNVFLIVPFFVVKDFREFVRFKLLVFWGMGIVMRPLFERYISADKQLQITPSPKAGWMQTVTASGPLKVRLWRRADAWQAAFFGPV